MQQKSTIAALIVAGGSSERLGAKIAKPYIPIAGKPLLRWSLDLFGICPSVDSIMVAIREDDLEEFRKVAAGTKAQYCIGGATRQESVRLGLEALAKNAPDYVLIHDAARPNVQQADVEKLITQLKSERNYGVSLARKVTDTIHRQNNAVSELEAVERQGLWAAETPQGFSFDLILEAHRNAGPEQFTDDIGLAGSSGMGIKFMESRSDNFKITYSYDLERFEAMHNKFIPRTGYGYDVHPLISGKGMMLGGIRIMHDKSLQGHSDADVVLHALTDALLGTCGAGDIGTHFPPSDDQWKNAASEIFIKKALELVAEKNGSVGNVDITILAEEPKIAPYRIMMQNNIAKMLGIANDNVNIKATTNEKMGFIGRGEGIAAHAVATVLYKG
ncbi:MAG: bifunctional 2-C-methyl-D-erythritol 4-phosphate cytidylyltransferase/2-C-methyl-D-erythritol 2,4-cyclodiphosphate synthase [Alphaproteobacteria bacterium]|nr:MAG: bifunctional 2-C-methyl-D-erythritol 4-phosphate cytidylyltransferase/2-C-methyl-D-erythritol 2,4-cyclodiphosphate synthase [Alphaproteobacteria bacterium]